MIIVAGHLTIKPGMRQAFLEGSYPAVIQARETGGCRDFVVAADPIEADRVNVFEQWDSVTHLNAFRGSGPGDDLSALISSFAVSQYEVTE